MNNCKNCGAQLNAGDQFCKNCGSSVNESTTTNNNVNNINNCKSCGAPLDAGDQFCKNCGSSINESATTNFNNVNNDVNNNQPAWQNGYNQQSGNTQISNGIGKYIIIGIVVVLVFFIVAGVVTNVVKSSSTTSETEKNSTYNVTYKNYTFKIPSDLVSEVDSEQLLIKDEDVTWLAVINTLSVNFSSIKSSSKEILGGLESKGWTVSDPVEKTYNGVNFLTFEGTYSGVKYIVFYSEINSSNSLYCVISNSKNTYNYDYYDKIVSIVSKATYTEKRTTSKSSNTIIDDLGNLDL